jgi:hypothetical protein
VFALHSLPHYFLPVRPPTFRTATTKERKPERMHVLFPRFFSPPSFFPTWKLDGDREEKMGERRRRILARVSSALFIPTPFSTATFILFTVEDRTGKEIGRMSADGREVGKKRRGAHGRSKGFAREKRQCRRRRRRARFSVPLQIKAYPPIVSHVSLSFFRENPVSLGRVRASENRQTASQST